ncbi:MAG: hypothetical protein ABIP19_09950, partial [Dermatophilaceae bacterium]
MSELPARSGQSQMLEPLASGEIEPGLVEPGEVPEGQVAFDINDFPGGARGAIEAVLMVIDEPVT